MFLEYFLRASDNLRNAGLQSAVKIGSAVSEDYLKALDLETDLPMPKELRQFYMELGDGFTFIPDDVSDSSLVGWEPMRLRDHKGCNIGFMGQIEEEAMHEINSPRPRADPVRLRDEMARRKQWVPFYGFVGGGDYLCVDTSETPNPIRSYESLSWRSSPQTWDFILAPSFTEFVERWSRYNFLTPSGEWTAFCQGRSGQFDWKPQHFPQIGTGVNKSRPDI